MASCIQHPDPNTYSRQCARVAYWTGGLIHFSPRGYRARKLGDRRSALSGEDTPQSSKARHLLGTVGQHFLSKIPWEAHILQSISTIVRASHGCSSSAQPACHKAVEAPYCIYCCCVEEGQAQAVSPFPTSSDNFSFFFFRRLAVLDT